MEDDPCPYCGLEYCSCGFKVPADGPSDSDDPFDAKPGTAVELVPAPLQIGLGEGRVAIALMHDGGIHGLMFRDAGGPHAIGTDGAATIPPGVLQPQPGDVFVVCLNREAALVLQDMVKKVVESFRTAEVADG